MKLGDEVCVVIIVEPGCLNPYKSLDRLMKNDP